MKIHEAVAVTHEVFIETANVELLASAISLARQANPGKWSEVRDVTTRTGGEFGRGVVVTIGLKASARRAGKITESLLSAAVATLSDHGKALLAGDQAALDRLAQSDAEAGV